jgi:hypothetical protein
VPASKEVEFIPGALTMAKKDEFSKHQHIVWPYWGWWATMGAEERGTNAESCCIKFSVTEVVTVEIPLYSEIQ